MLWLHGRRQILTKELNNMKANDIAKGGLLTALGVVLIYLSNILPGSKLFVLAVASSLVPIAVLKLKMRGSLLMYISTSMLSLIIIGPKDVVITYIAFFGIYGLIKFFIERLNNLPLEIILKLIFYNLAALILFLVYKAFFLNGLNLKMPIYIIILFSEIIFLMYDYALTLFISYFNKHLSKKL